MRAILGWLEAGEVEQLLGLLPDELLDRVLAWRKLSG